MKEKSFKILFYTGLSIVIVIIRLTGRVFYEEIILTWQMQTKLSIGYEFAHKNLFNALSVISIPFSIIWIVFYLIYKKKIKQNYQDNRLKFFFFIILVCLSYLAIPYDFKFSVIEWIKNWF